MCILCLTASQISRCKHRTGPPPRRVQCRRSVYTHPFAWTCVYCHATRACARNCLSSLVTTRLVTRSIQRQVCALRLLPEQTDGLQWSGSNKFLGPDTLPLRLHLGAARATLQHTVQRRPRPLASATSLRAWHQQSVIARLYAPYQPATRAPTAAGEILQATYAVCSFFCYLALQNANPPCATGADRQSGLLSCRKDKQTPVRSIRSPVAQQTAACVPQSTNGSGTCVDRPALGVHTLPQSPTSTTALLRTAIASALDCRQAAHAAEPKQPEQPRTLQCCVLIRLL